MAELVLGPVIEKIIDERLEYLKYQFRWQRGMKKELEDLLIMLPEIQDVVSAYNQVEMKDSVLNLWYWQVRDAVDEADDVLDEIEYMKLEKQASKNKKTGKVRSLMKSMTKRLIKNCKRALKIDPTLKGLEEAVHKLHEISAKVCTFRHLSDHVKEEQQQQLLQLQLRRETGPKPHGNDFVGRSNEITRVTNWLSKPIQAQVSDPHDLYSNISLLSVVGHGGMGKTALLQRVYEDVEVMKGFDVKIWVCVSTNFDAAKVIKKILESLQKKWPDLGTLEALQYPLKSELMSPTQSQSVVMPPIQSEIMPLQSENKSKRFLLVLDDIWEEDETCWGKVLDTLRFGSQGSKILITTRMNSVASMFAKMVKDGNEKLSLESLEEEELLKLFNTHAFAGVENLDDDEFKDIAKKMVKKLLGCPLIAKLIGSFLHLNMDKRFWIHALNTNIGNINPIESGLDHILELSYMRLPNYLQNCFSFCCIFPQDYEFDKDDVVRMWIALDYIYSSTIQPGETLVDIGRNYFNILVQRSFFDEFRDYRGIVRYKMHNLLHALAQSVFAQECLRIVDDSAFSIPRTIRHLYIHISSNLEAAFKEVGEFKNLRSLFLSFSDVAQYDEKVLNEILKASKSIRLLVINYHKLQKIPETIDCLIHLRYLKTDGIWGFELPRSISHLHHLQFIILPKQTFRPSKHCKTSLPL